MRRTQWTRSTRWAVWMGATVLIAAVFVPAVVRSARLKDDKATEARLLRNQRRYILQNLVKVLETQHTAGQVNIADLVVARNELTTVEIELASSFEQREQLHQRRVEWFKRLEEQAEARYKAGIGPIASLLSAQAAHLQARIDLVELRRERDRELAP